MRSTTVVFRGCAQVIEAYQANDIGPWAIVNGSTILCADETDSVTEGVRTLEDALKRLQVGNSRASFDLKVYKLKAGQEILPNTQEYRGFRFSLYADSEMTPYESGRQNGMVVYDERLQMMQKEISELKAALAKAEEEEEYEKSSSVNAMISGILEMPNVKQALSMKLVGLIDKVIPLNLGGAARPAAIAGIEGRSLLDPEQQQKVQQAVNILCSKDAKLGDHLLGVANIAVTNPDQYNMLIRMLK
jgi:hypothetical protein